MRLNGLACVDVFGEGAGQKPVDWRRDWTRTTFGRRNSRHRAAGAVGGSVFAQLRAYPVLDRGRIAGKLGRRCRDEPGAFIASRCF